MLQVDGSINIFLKVDSTKIGTINADGGMRGNDKSGGNGCISVGNISTGQYVELESEVE